MQAKSPDDAGIIDVSHHQKNIDWSKVKKAIVDGLPIEGVLIKATEGRTYIDSKLSSHAHGASSVQLPMTFYHYGRPDNNTPQDEAANFWRNVKQYKADFPYILDIEDDKEHNISKLGKEYITSWCKTWLLEVSRISGRPTMIYSNTSFVRSCLGEDLRSWPLWIAHYGSDKPGSNSVWNEWAVFQYDDKGRVDGIIGDVDLNVMERSFFDRYCGASTAEQDDGIKVVVNNEVVTVGQIIDGHINGEIATVLRAAGVPFTYHPEQQKLYIFTKS